VKTTKSPRPDFKKHSIASNKWYDLYDDWHLIESSFAQQYGIRLRSDTEMTWDEFSTLLAGIMPETPLGQIISIRSETTPEILETFNSEQKRIRNEWHSKVRKEIVENKKNAEAMIAEFQAMMKQAFS